MHEILFTLALIFISGIAIWMSYVWFTKKGRGSLFGGEIRSTYEVPLNLEQFARSKKTLRIYEIERDGSPNIIGLEMTAKIGGKFTLLTLNMSSVEASELSNNLIYASKSIENESI